MSDNYKFLRIKLKISFAFSLIIFSINLYSQVTYFDVMLQAGSIDLKDCHSKVRSSASFIETRRWIESKINSYYKRNYYEILKDNSKDVSISEFRFSITDSFLVISFTHTVKESIRVYRNVMDPTGYTDKYENKEYLESKGFRIPIKKMYEVTWSGDKLTLRWYDNDAIGGTKNYTIYILEQEQDLKERLLKAFCHLHKLVNPIRQEVF